MKDAFLKSGPLSIENDMYGNVKIVRQDNAQAVVVSCSEWQWIIKASEFLGYPTAPPTYDPAEQS